MKREATREAVPAEKRRRACPWNAKAFGAGIADDGKKFMCNNARCHAVTASWRPRGPERERERREERRRQETEDGQREEVGKERKPRARAHSLSRAQGEHVGERAGAGQRTLECERIETKNRQSFSFLSSSSSSFFLPSFPPPRRSLDPVWRRSRLPVSVISLKPIFVRSKRIYI